MNTTTPRAKQSLPGSENIGNDVSRTLDSLEKVLDSLSREDRLVVLDRVIQLRNQAGEKPGFNASFCTAQSCETQNSSKTRTAGANISQLAQRRKETIHDIIKKLQVLPVSSSAPMRILALQRDDKAGAEDFAKVLSVDPGLSSKILGLANSAWFSPRSPITRLSAAIAAIGMRNLMPLLFSLSLTGTFSELKIPQSEKDAIWRGSLLKAASAREYARVFCPGIADEAFLCGLLQDISLPILHASDTAAWAEACTLIDADSETRATREVLLYGMQHAEATRIVGRRLGLPESLLAVMDVHHEPMMETCADQTQHLVNAARLAGLMPHRILSQQGISVQPREPVGHYTPAGSAITIANVLSSIPAAFKELLGMLGAGDSPGGFTEFLQKLSGEMSRSVEDAINLTCRKVAHLQSSQEDLKSRLAAQESQAAVAGDFDPMTRLLNHAGLSRRTPNIFSVACEYQQECGIVHIALKNFRDLNRKCGHEQGDKALMQVGDIMRKFLRGAGIGSRIGGVEFVLIFLGKNRQESIKLIETLESDLSLQRVGCEQLPLDCSLRTHWIDFSDKTLDPEKILKDFIVGKS